VWVKDAGESKGLPVMGGIENDFSRESGQTSGRSFWARDSGEFLEEWNSK